MAATYGETPSGLSSCVLNLGGVLTRKALLKVPRYQRPYTWGEREVRQLIQDLWRAYKRNAKYYFVGQIVLVINDRGELEISDGQQRLSTSTMILAYVRDRLPAWEQYFQGLIMTPDGRPRLTLRESDASFFQGWVQEPGNMAKLARHQTGRESQDAMCAAAETIAAELNGVDDRQLQGFMKYAISSTTFNVVDADYRGDAASIYNAMNDTGVALSAADNIKCDLLEGSGLTHDEAEQAAQNWEKLENDLGRDDFARLIQQMPFLLTGAEMIAPGDIGDFRKRIVESGGVRNFLINVLPRYGEALKEIISATADVGAASAEVNRRIKLMLQLTEWRWQPAALVFLAKHRNQPERAARFFQALERFAYGCELSVIDYKVREDRFARAVEFAGQDKAFEQGGPLDLDETERMGFIERLDRVAKIDRQRRLLMIRIEAAIGGRVLPRNNPDITVEHVLPSGHAPWWEERIPDPKLRAEMANLLGNCTLITRKQNVKADNKPFPEKTAIYFQTAGAPIHDVTRDIAGIQEWSVDVIEERHERLVAILCRDWDIVRGKRA